MWAEIRFFCDTFYRKSKVKRDKNVSIKSFIFKSFCYQINNIEQKPLQRKNTATKILVDERRI